MTLKSQLPIILAFSVTLPPIWSNLTSENKNINKKIKLGT